MATVVFGDRGFDLSNDPSYGALDPINGAKYELLTDTSIVLRGTDGSKDVFKGSFASPTIIANELYVSGTMTSYERYYPDGQLAYSVTGIRQEIYSFLTESHRLPEKANVIHQKQILLSGTDTITGGMGNDVFIFTNGNDVIDGRGGIDTLYFDGIAVINRIGQKDYQITVNGTTNTYKDIERVIYRGDNGMVGYTTDVDGNAGKAYRLYQAAFDRTPDPGGLGTWIGLMDKGMSLEEVSSYFQRSDEFKSLYGTNVSNQQFVDLLYKNVLDRPADDQGYATWKGVLDAGTWTREQVLIGFSESTENQLKVIGSIQNGIEYFPGA